ncbi:hypothetical protein ABZW30_12940 [Kitasatospora sp. NPDC004669]|uniref:hypothetical protein n=1 Tax=Kitasatospora sp. NPDC004669 TaxID=3154555 RepID=UPI0033B5F28D
MSTICAPAERWVFNLRSLLSVVTPTLIHGWRAWSRDTVRDVDWANPTQPRLITAAAND